MSDLASIRLELCQLRQHVEELSSRLSTKCSCTKYTASYQESASKGIDVEQTDHCSNQVTTDVSQYATGTPKITENVDMSTEDCQSGSTTHSKSGDSQCSDNPTLTGLNYVETLKANLDEREEVNRKTRRNRKNKHSKPPVKPVVGDSKTGVPFNGVEKKTVICISRLQRNTSVEQITNFLQSKDVPVLSCRAYSDKHDRYTFMRVCLPQSHVHKVYIASMWPLWVVIRPWVFKPGAATTNQMDSATDQ